MFRWSSGTCLSLPAGTHFQFRATGAARSPPWP